MKTIDETIFSTFSVSTFGKKQYCASAAAPILSTSSFVQLFFFPKLKFHLKIKIWESGGY